MAVVVCQKCSSRFLDEEHKTCPSCGESDHRVDSQSGASVARTDKQVGCPKCGSEQITAQRRGYGVGKGVIGALALGPLGLVAGAIGNKKIVVTCLACGHSWKTGK